MTRSTTAALVAAIIALTITSAASAADIGALDVCYANVLTACGQTAHPHSCATRAFERCEKVNNMTNPVIFVGNSQHGRSTADLEYGEFYTAS